MKNTFGSCFGLVARKKKPAPHQEKYSFFNDADDDDDLFNKLGN